MLKFEKHIYRNSEKVFYTPDLVGCQIRGIKFSEKGREYNCDHLYWSSWDERRYMFLVDLDTDIKIVYCFDED